MLINIVLHPPAAFAAAQRQFALLGPGTIFASSAQLLIPALRGMLAAGSIQGLRVYDGFGSVSAHPFSSPRDFAFLRGHFAPGAALEITVFSSAAATGLSGGGFGGGFSGVTSGGDARISGAALFHALPLRELADVLGVPIRQS